MKMTKSLIAVAGAAALGVISFAMPASAQSKGLVFYGLQMEELEYRRGDEKENLLAWNGDAFIGTDEVKLRWLGEGEYDWRADKFETLENRLAVQVPVSDFFDVKAGARFDSPKGPNRKYGFVGLTGLAPQWFEIDLDLFYSEKRNLSARLDAEYELLINNRLILTPSLEVNLAFSDDTPIEVRSGFTDLEVGARLSYDLIDRMVSPYVGAFYERKLGNTADYLSAEGGDIDGWRAVIGLRMTF
jgi:copper resistance protein B